MASRLVPSSRPQQHASSRTLKRVVPPAGQQLMLESQPSPPWQLCSGDGPAATVRLWFGTWQSPWELAGLWYVCLPSCSTGVSSQVLQDACDLLFE